MQLNQSEAYYILTNLDEFIANFENGTQKKVTPGAMNLIQKILVSKSFPEKNGLNNLH